MMKIHSKKDIVIAHIICVIGFLAGLSFVLFGVIGLVRLWL